MNYYEHHLGDYVRDTAHLSMLEDGAYRRLIDAYYIRERPLPAELRDVYRLVRAASKQDREAVDTVLREFFDLTVDGWRHERCERELDRFREGEAERDAARGNAKERQRRTRERRRELFDALREHDIVPAYDTQTIELQRLLSRVTGRDRPRDVTRDVTAYPPPPVTCDATATQIPVSSTPPSLRSGGDARANRHAPVTRDRNGSRLPPDWEPDPEARAWATAELGSAGAADREVAKFRDYWAAKAGKDATKLDWGATWRNWIRRTHEQHENRSRSSTGSAGKPSAVDRVYAATERFLAEPGGGDVLAPHGGNVRPQVDELPGRDPDGAMVEGDFEVIGRTGQAGAR